MKLICSVIVLLVSVSTIHSEDVDTTQVVQITTEPSTELPAQITTDAVPTQSGEEVHQQKPRPTRHPHPHCDQHRENNRLLPNMPFAPLPYFIPQPIYYPVPIYPPYFYPYQYPKFPHPAYKTDAIKQKPGNAKKKFVASQKTPKHVVNEEIGEKSIGKIVMLPLNENELVYQKVEQ